MYDPLQDFEVLLGFSGIFLYAFIYYFKPTPIFMN